MESNIPVRLTLYDFPSEDGRRTRAASGLERLSRQVRRRSRVAVLFSNVASCERLVTAVLMEISEEWEAGRKYLRLEDNGAA